MHFRNERPRRSALSAAGMLVPAALAVCALLTACVRVDTMRPSRTLEGLQRIQGRQADVVYTAPGSSLAGYRAVMLDAVDVGFRRDWKSAHPDLTASDVERIRSEAADLFRQVFARELDERGGYAVTTSPGADVLRVRASIVDLDISQPAGSPGSATSYRLSPRQLTLVAELRDSVSGAILVRAADRERGRAMGDLQVTSAMSSSTEAGDTFALWAGLLRQALDTARTAPAPPP
jgi:hypothetical protein